MGTSGMKRTNSETPPQVEDETGVFIFKHLPSRSPQIFFAAWSTHCGMTRNHVIDQRCVTYYIIKACLLKAWTKLIGTDNIDVGLI